MYTSIWPPQIRPESSAMSSASSYLAMTGCRVSMAVRAFQNASFS